MTTNPILIGLGAGLVSAILFATTISGTPLALLLSYVAPLPILIAGLGWTPLAAVLAVATGGAALSLFLQSKIALVFALGIGAPAAALSYVALSRLRDARTGLEVWLPLGLVLAGVPLLAAFVTWPEPSPSRPISRATRSSSPARSRRWCACRSSVREAAACACRRASA